MMTLAMLTLPAFTLLRHGPATTTAAPALPVALPAGRWETFASGNDVLALAVEGTTVWAGTRAGGLVRWDTVSGSYVQYLRPQDPLGGNTVVDIAIGPQGGKWLATEGGLSVLEDGGTADRADDVWRTYTRAGTGGALPSDDVRAVAIHGDLVWVGTQQVWNSDEEVWEGGGLARLDTRGTATSADDTWAPVATYAGTITQAPDGSQLLGLVSDNITDLAVTAAGDLWVATTTHWSFEQPPVAELPPHWTRVHGGISHLATRGTADPADDVWTATDCDKMQATVTCTVQALGVDAAGIGWAAIAGRGVMYFPGGDPVIIDERSRRFDLPSGAPDDFVDAIAFGPADDPALKHTVWLARRKGGLSVLNHGGTLRDRTDDVWDLGRGRPLTTADGLAQDRAQAVAVGNGAVWVGTGPLFGVAGGISRADMASGAIEAPLVTSNAPPTNFITELGIGAAGTRWAGHVWLATGSRAERRFGAGAVDLDTNGTLDRADDQWTHHTTGGTDADGRPPWTGLSGDNVQAVALQGDRVWLGSSQSVWDQAAGTYTDGGLSVFDGQRWTARRAVPAVNGTPGPGLGHGSVSALAVGCGGELWVGTGNDWDYWGAGVDVLTVVGSVHEPAADRWVAHRFPTIASNNTTAIAPDCLRDRVWVSAEHHVSQGDPASGSAGGLLVGGGVSLYDLATEAWTRIDADDGLEGYAEGYINSEATDVLAGPDGTVWAGAYGTRVMDKGTLLHLRPFYPAVLNQRRPGETTWSAQLFEGAGYVSALATDGQGRLWVATSRGGAARDSARPENWRVDRDRGGLMVLDGDSWVKLDITSSGIPCNDISDVAVGPDGDIWLASEGWGLARFSSRADPPTPTPTYDAPTPTRTLTPTATRDGEATPTRATTATASATPSATRSPTGSKINYLPFAVGGAASGPRPTVRLSPTATRRPGPTATPWPVAGRALIPFAVN